MAQVSVISTEEGIERSWKDRCRPQAARGGSIFLLPRLNTWHTLKPKNMNPELAHLCAVCYGEMEDGSTVNSPACACKFHAACLIKLVADTPQHIDIYSPCGTNLYSRNFPEDAESEPPIESVPPPVAEFFAANPTAKAELKALKQNQMVAKKAATQLRRFVSEHNKQFKNEVAPLKQQIRQFRSVHRAAYKASVERKTYQTALTKYKQAYKSFRCKYNVSRTFMERLKLSSIRKYSPLRRMYRFLPWMRV